MIPKRAIAIAACIAALASSVHAQDTLASTPSGKPHPRVHWQGWALLGTEYLVMPYIASQFWWKQGLTRNPFKNMGEEELYLSDKAQHIWDGEWITDYNHWMLKKYFHHDSPILAMALAFATLTGIELMDGASGTGWWYFSPFDEWSNIAGIMLWYAKHRYPAWVPLDIRVGIRQWKKADQLWKGNADYLFTGDDRGVDHTYDYSIEKTEFIIRVNGYWYLGGALSLRYDQRNNPANLWGVTAGYDVIRGAANARPGRLTPLANVFGRYLSLSIAHTHWFEK